MDTVILGIIQAQVEPPQHVDPISVIVFFLVPFMMILYLVMLLSYTPNILRKMQGLLKEFLELRMDQRVRGTRCQSKPQTPKSRKALVVFSTNQRKALNHRKALSQSKALVVFSTSQSKALVVFSTKRSD